MNRLIHFDRLSAIYLNVCATSQHKKNPSVFSGFCSDRIQYFSIVLFITFMLLLKVAQGQIPLIHYDSVDVIEEGSPLTNPWAGGMNCPQFSETDLDGDGKNDLVAFERNFYGAVKTFINKGTASQVDYQYAPEYQRRFPQMRNWMLLRDYNCDGKEDIFTSVPAGVAVYRNDTEPGEKLKFTQVVTLLQTIGLNGQTPLYVSPPDIPAIADIDNDGDLDFLSFNILGSTVEYHKNYSMENHGNCDFLEYELKNACWGYFSEDGTTNTVTLYDTCENNVPDPEKSGKHAGSTILAIDLTGNGVKDLVLGDITYQNMVMLTNGGTTTSSGMVASDTAFPSNTTPAILTVFPAGYSIDVDNDGNRDLLVAPNNPNTSENKNNIWYYNNVGNNEIPEFIYQHSQFLQGGMIDAGERSYPVFFDENGDGLFDIVMGNFGYFISSGNYSSQLLLMRNTGTQENPSFEVITNDYQDLSGFGFDGLYPAFGDMDNDGDQDMITGDEEGNLHYFRNDAGAGNPADFNLSQPNYKGIDIGQSAKPQIIDVNRDGLPDLLAGERSGTVNYFENIGTSENADFNSEPSNDFFGSIDVMPECCTGYSTPFITEDSTGNYMLYVGSEQGKIYLFNDIENNLDGAFNLVDSLYLSAINVNISGVDLNNDSTLEMVFGEYGGGLGLLKYGIPQGLGLINHRIGNLAFRIYPNPAKNKVMITVNDKNNRSQKNIKVTILNSLGQIIENYTFVNSSGSEYIDLNAYKEGIYFVRVHTDSGSGTVKLIVN